MTHPLQGTLENRDGAWVLTLIRDFAHPRRAGVAVAHRSRPAEAMVADRAGPLIRRRRCATCAGEPRRRSSDRRRDLGRSTTRTRASLGRRRRALAAHTDRYRLPAHAGADHARPGPRRDERSRVASVPRRARRRAERRCDVSSRRGGRTRPRVGGLARRLHRTARRLITAAGRRGRRPRRCCRPGHGRTRRSIRGDTPATAAARATTRHRPRPRRRRRP